MMDSRTILDRSGAQQLTGPGDMLVSHGRVESKRLQAAFTDREDITSIVQHISAQHSDTSTYLLPKAKVKSSPHADVDMNRLDRVLKETAGPKSKSPDIEEVRETIEGLKRGIWMLEKWIDDMDDEGIYLPDE